MQPHEKVQIEKFFSTIEPWIKAYSHIGLSYFAVRKDGEINLLQARLFLNTAPSTIPTSHIGTASVLAGHFNFTELGMTLRGFVDRLVEDGEIATPLGKFKFPSEKGGEFSAYFDPFHQEGIAGGNRLTVLTIRGASKWQLIEQTKFDWELKAAPKPFDSLDELLSFLALGGSRDNSANIEIVAYHVAEINFSSVISGEDAKPSVFLAKTLDPNKCQIGYRVFLHGKVVQRESIQGGDFTWTEQDRFLLGEGLVGIPQGAVLHCVASYAGYAQHQGWIADPAHSQNARRVSLESFDERLEILRDYLFEELKPRKNARDFEFGVAWLVWMLGFSINQVGGTARTSDAPDILATSPKGNILVVECTTGLLKAENKLANLIDRTEAIRKRLAISGNSHLKLLPVIVTAKTKEEIKADLEQAQKLGVLVVTQEVLQELLQQTIAAPDPEAIYTRAWNGVQPKPDWIGSISGKA
jgi:hypothetical protein